MVVGKRHTPFFTHQAPIVPEALASSVSIPTQHLAERFGPTAGKASHPSTIVLPPCDLSKGMETTVVAMGLRLGELRQEAEEFLQPHSSVADVSLPPPPPPLQKTVVPSVAESLPPPPPLQKTAVPPVAGSLPPPPPLQETTSLVAIAFASSAHPWLDAAAGSIEHGYVLEPKWLRTMILLQWTTAIGIMQ